MTSLLHLVDRAERGALLPAEAQQLRDGIRALLENAATHAAVRPPGGPERPSAADDAPDGARGAVADVQRFEADAPELTAEEARDLAAELAIDLYRAQDALAFVSEMCDIADRQSTAVTTAMVRRWLEGPKCAGQLVTLDPPAPAGTTKEN